MAIRVQMGKTRFLFFCVLLITLLAVPLISFAEADGFRDIKWGSDFATLSGMQYVRTDTSYGGIKEYSRKGDELQIGGAKLENIEYGFWQGKFCNIIIRIKGYGNYSALKDATFEKFGSGYKPNQFMEKYAWFGETTTMLLEYSEISKAGSLFMSSKRIQAKQELYEQENAKKGAEKGF